MDNEYSPAGIRTKWKNLKLVGLGRKLAALTLKPYVQNSPPMNSLRPGR